MSHAPFSNLTVLCLASYFKGNDFLRQCKAQGCHVILLVKDKLKDEDWARESVDTFVPVANHATPVRGTGQSVLVRLLMVSDGNLNRGGFWVDDLSLEAAAGCGRRLALASLAVEDGCSRGGPGDGNGEADTGEDLALALTVTNHGTLPATAVEVGLTTTAPVARRMALRLERHAIRA